MEWINISLPMETYAIKAIGWLKSYQFIFHTKQNYFINLVYPKGEQVQIELMFSGLTVAETDNKVFKFPWCNIKIPMRCFVVHIS